MTQTEAQLRTKLGIPSAVLEEIQKPSRTQHQEMMPNKTLFVSPGEIEGNGYAVVSQDYLARLEMVAHSSFAFLGGEIDFETLHEELTNL